MELGVLRKYFKDTYTIGKFSIDGKSICETLEDKVRELHDINHDGDFTDTGEGKIYGETAIPCGRYMVELTWWPKHQKFAPILKDVPGFTGILIHSGVTAKDTEGCILVGENKEKGKLINGPYWSSFVTQAIQKAIEENEKVFITIKQ
jgi:hypothetical protein